MKHNAANHFSGGAATFFSTIAPQPGPGKRVFPPKPRITRISIPNTEDTDSWAKRELLSDQQWLRNNVIEDNIIVDANISWDREMKIEEMSMQALVAIEGTFFETRSKQKEKLRFQYFRFDYHQGCLGNLFSEAIPHLHVRPKREPRLCLSYHLRENAIVDFIEFLYRSYRWDDWKTWAKNVWEYSKYSRGSKIYSFDSICDAFRHGRFDDLAGGMSHSVALLKKALAEEKDRITSLRINTAHCSVLNYP
jgi:hypothetical protein